MEHVDAFGDLGGIVGRAPEGFVHRVEQSLASAKACAPSRFFSMRAGMCIGPDQKFTNRPDARRS
jgi:hypothetical protein